MDPSRQKTYTPAPVSITGWGAITSLGDTVDTLMKGLYAGRTALQPADPELRRKHPIFPVGRTPRLSSKDPKVLEIAIQAAKDALKMAGWSDSFRADGRTLLVVATTKAQIEIATDVFANKRSNSELGEGLIHALAPELAFRLDMKGPLQTVSLACASGLVAVGRAWQAVRSGEAHRALVVGCDAVSDFVYGGFSNLNALDPQGARPFDTSRAGLSIGEGAGAITLESGSGGIEIVGYGASNDANHITGPSRDGSGLVLALESALEEAQLAASSIGFGILHGTGTLYNDAMEGQAYARVFGPHALPLAGVKGSIGHLMGAAGVINLIVAAQALKDSCCPPNTGLKTPDPTIPLDLVKEHPRRLSHVEFAITSASGFAGVNAALLLRQIPLPFRTTNKQAPHLSPPTRAALTCEISLSNDRRILTETIGARSARRLDHLSLATVAAVNLLLRKAGLADNTISQARHTLILGTSLGCLQSDHAYYMRELRPEEFPPSPRLFAYTLPNIALGETAIRHLLHGQNYVLSAGAISALTALSEASRMVSYEQADVVIAVAADAVGDEFASIEGGNPSIQAWLIESEEHARNRNASALGFVHGELKAGPFGPRDENHRPQSGDRGIDEFKTLLRQLRRGDVEVMCDRGYGVRIHFEPKNGDETL